MKSIGIVKLIFWSVVLNMMRMMLIKRMFLWRILRRRLRGFVMRMLC